MAQHHVPGGPTFETYISLYHCPSNTLLSTYNGHQTSAWNAQFPTVKKKPNKHLHYLVATAYRNNQSVCGGGSVASHIYLGYQNWVALPLLPRRTRSIITTTHFQDTTKVNFGFAASSYRLCGGGGCGGDDQPTRASKDETLATDAQSHQKVPRDTPTFKADTHTIHTKTQTTRRPTQNICIYGPTDAHPKTRNVSETTI